HGLFTEVRERCEQVAIVQSCHAYDVRQIVVRREMRAAVIVGAAVAGSGHKENAVLTSGADSFLKRLGPLGRAPAGTDNANVHTVSVAVDGVVDGLDRVLGRTEPAASEKLERHNLDVPVH